MKQTKSMRFRALLPVILDLENSKLHLQDGIIEILKRDYDLDISLNTYRNYLFRYAPKVENLDANTSAISPKKNLQKTTIEPIKNLEKDKYGIGNIIKNSPKDEPIANDLNDGELSEAELSEALKKLEGELASDKAKVLVNKSLLRKD